MESGNIVKALAAINKEIDPIGKTRKNEQQGFKFRGIDEVMNELHSLFAKHEVIILPEVLDIETTEKVTQRGGTLFYVKAKIRFTFTCTDGSSVSTVIVGEAMDSGDKATNKAMSIALKYALLQMFLIPTEEDKDPDAQSHELKAPAKKQEPRQEPKQEFDPLHYDMAMSQMNGCKDLESLKSIWATYKAYQPKPDFIAAKEAKKAELNGKVKEAAQ